MKNRISQLSQNAYSSLSEKVDWAKKALTSSVHAILEKSPSLKNALLWCVVVWSLAWCSEWSFIWIDTDKCDTATTLIRDKQESNRLILEPYINSWHCDCDVWMKDLITTYKDKNWIELRTNSLGTIWFEWCDGIEVDYTIPVWATTADVSFTRIKDWIAEWTADETIDLEKFWDNELTWSSGNNTHTAPINFYQVDQAWNHILKTDYILTSNITEDLQWVLSWDDFTVTLWDCTQTLNSSLLTYKYFSDENWNILNWAPHSSAWFSLPENDGTPCEFDNTYAIRPWTKSMIVELRDANNTNIVYHAFVN